VTRELHRLKRRCVAIARSVPLPQPFEVRALCELVAQGRGRPIHLLPMKGLATVHGLWIATDSADLLCYEQATTPPHQEHIILHELSHLLCDHYSRDPHDAQHMRTLLPDLAPELVRRMLRRTTLQAVEEREAELLASLIMRRARRFAAPGRPESPLDDTINAMFDWTPPGP
jgi:hypothetical protein